MRTCQAFLRQGLPSKCRGWLCFYQLQMSGSGDCETGGPQPSLPAGGPSGVSQCQGSSCTCGGGGGSSSSSTPGSGSNGGTNICNGASGSSIVQSADGGNAGPGSSNGQPGVNLCGQTGERQDAAVTAALQQAKLGQLSLQLSDCRLKWGLAVC